MSSYIEISILKNSVIPAKKLRMFLGYLPQECLKEYLSYGKIYDGKRNGSKLDQLTLLYSAK